MQNKAHNLKGLSGCLLELCMDKGEHIVRKISPTPLYNNRLKKQCEKQELFYSSTVKAPQVLDVGYNEDGLFFFTMPYINGTTLYDFIDLNPLSVSIHLFKEILDTVLPPTDLPFIKAYTPVFNKLQELKSKVEGYNTLFTYLENNIPDVLPSSKTHGDLTFENIIISDKQEIYFIDLLDSFVDTFYVDLAKLNQEFKILWSIRKKDRCNNLVIKYTKLNEIFEKSITASKIDQNVLDFFTIVNLLRIIPYTNNRDTVIISTELDKWKAKLNL